MTDKTAMLGFRNGRLVAISVDGDHHGIADDWRDRGYAILRVPASEAIQFWADATDDLHPAGVPLPGESTA